MVKKWVRLATVYEVIPFKEKKTNKVTSYDMAKQQTLLYALY